MEIFILVSYRCTFFNMALEIPARHMSVMPEAASHRSWSQHSGNTPLDDARSRGHDEIVTLLERAESWLHGGVNGSSSVGAALSVTNDVNGALCHWRPGAMKIATERLRNCVIFWIDCYIMMLMLGLLGLPCFTLAEALRKATNICVKSCFVVFSGLLRYVSTLGTTNL